MYDKFIADIIAERGQWGLSDQYWEGHHIIPKCLGGKGNSRCKHENIIRLSASEHYIAHKLLAEKYPDNSSILQAWACISHAWNDNRLTTIEISAEEYADMKEKTRAAFRWYTNGEEEIRALSCPDLDGWRPGRADRIIEAIRNAPHRGLRGDKNGMYGKTQSSESNWKRYQKCSSYSWYNNGISELYSIEQPDGYSKGRLKGRRKWYTNGEREVLSLQLPGSDFVEGRLPRLRAETSAKIYTVIYRGEGANLERRAVKNTRNLDNFLRDGWRTEI